MANTLRHRAHAFFLWLKLLWRRIDEDNMTTQAGNLAYVSLLALVPLVAVIFALFAAFPVFSDISVQLKNFIFTNFMPAAGDVIQRYLDQFVANVNKMTAVGAVGLIVTALLLMHSVDSALNAIWRSNSPRPMIYSFAVYWMILTLGPLLAGASLAISSYLLSLGQCHRRYQPDRPGAAYLPAGALHSGVLAALQRGANAARAGARCAHRGGGGRPAV